LHKTANQNTGYLSDHQEFELEQPEATPKYFKAANYPFWSPLPSEFHLQWNSIPGLSYLVEFVRDGIGRFHKRRRQGTIDFNHLSTCVTIFDLLGSSRIFEQLLDVTNNWLSSVKWNSQGPSRKLAYIGKVFR
jgi:hypothetical protein